MFLRDHKERLCLDYLYFIYKQNDKEFLFKYNVEIASTFLDYFPYGIKRARKQFSIFLGICKIIEHACKASKSEIDIDIVLK